MIIIFSMVHKAKLLYRKLLLILPMNLGLNKNGKHIRPSETGDRATHKMCGGILIAHCGDFRPKHWQNKRKKRLRFLERRRNRLAS